jgi:hypothetical protein
MCLPGRKLKSRQEYLPLDWRLKPVVPYVSHNAYNRAINRIDVRCHPQTHPQR